MVVDDLASTNPWRPRAIEVRDRADAIEAPEAMIRIHPERIISWGLDGERSAREGEWIEIPALDEAIVVNFGALLERWTSGRVRATPHRVLSAGPPATRSRSSSSLAPMR